MNFCCDVFTSNPQMSHVRRVFLQRRLLYQIFAPSKNLESRKTHLNPLIKIQILKWVPIIQAAWNVHHLDIENFSFFGRYVIDSFWSNLIHSMDLDNIRCILWNKSEHWQHIFCKRHQAKYIKVKDWTLILWAILLTSAAKRILPRLMWHLLLLTASNLLASSFSSFILNISKKSRCLKNRVLNIFYYLNY